MESGCRHGRSVFSTSDGKPTRFVAGKSLSAAERGSGLLWPSDAFSLADLKVLYGVLDPKQSLDCKVVEVDVHPPQPCLHKVRYG